MQNTRTHAILPLLYRYMPTCRSTFEGSRPTLNLNLACFTILHTPRFGGGEQRGYAYIKTAVRDWLPRTKCKPHPRECTHLISSPKLSLCPSTWLFGTTGNQTHSVAQQKHFSLLARSGFCPPSLRPLSLKTTLTRYPSFIARQWQGAYKHTSQGGCCQHLTQRYLVRCETIGYTPIVCA